VQDVRLVLRAAFLVQTRLRLPEHRAELHATVGEALAQHFQKPHHLHLAAEAVHNLPLAVRAVELFVPRPLLGLAGFKESEERPPVQRNRAVKGGGITLLIAAFR